MRLRHRAIRRMSQPVDEVLLGVRSKELHVYGSYRPIIRSSCRIAERSLSREDEIENGRVT